MTYVDGFVFTVKRKNLKAYKKMASEASRVWKRFGALQYFECQGNDLKISKSHGPIKSFIKLTKSGKDEIPFFSFITFRSKAHRDKVNKDVMKHFDEKYKDSDMSNMPFDVRKMAYGGFETIVEA